MTFVVRRFASIFSSSSIVLLRIGIFDLGLLVQMNDVNAWQSIIRRFKNEFSLNVLFKCLYSRLSSVWCVLLANKTFLSAQKSVDIDNEQQNSSGGICKLPPRFLRPFIYKHLK